LRPFVSPASTFTYDAMHVLLSNGTCQTEVDIILQRAHAEGLDMSSVQDFLGLPWGFCKAYGSRRVLTGCLSAARLKSFRKEGSLRVGASEMLVLLPILAFFFRTVVAKSGKLLLEIQCLESLCLVVELYRKGKDGQHVADELERAVGAHAKLFLDVYGAEHVKPKAHYAQHLAGQLRRDGFIIDCFTGERKHQVIKAMSREIKNTSAFEKSVLFPTLAKSLTDIEGLREGLNTPQPCPKDVACDLGLPGCLFGCSVRWRGLTLPAGDVVMIDGTWYSTAAFFAVATTLFLLGNVLESRDQVRFVVVFAVRPPMSV